MSTVVAVHRRETTSGRYIVEPYVLDDLRNRRLRAILGPFAPTSPG
jgi:hypothetical protein